MFETLEVGKRIKNSEFNDLELTLRHQLLNAQFDLAERDYPVIIVIAGLDGAGKGTLVHRLSEWMDPRGEPGLHGLRRRRRGSYHRRQ